MILKKTNVTAKECVVHALKKGEVVIIPTDTVYGFSGIVPTSQDAIKTIKGRDENKPFIQLIGAPEDIKKYSDSFIPQKVLDAWPGALTVIVKAKDADSTIAFRCPGDAWLRDIIKEVESPIYSTSVNRSGKAILHTISDIREEFESEVSLIIDAGKTNQALPSTIVDVTAGELKIIRQGSLQL